MDKEFDRAIVSPAIWPEESGKPFFSRKAVDTKPDERSSCQDDRGKEVDH